MLKIRTTLQSYCNPITHLFRQQTWAECICQNDWNCRSSGSVHCQKLRVKDSPARQTSVTVKLSFINKLTNIGSINCDLLAVQMFYHHICAVSLYISIINSDVPQATVLWEMTKNYCTLIFPHFHLEMFFVALSYVYIFLCLYYKFYYFNYHHNFKAIMYTTKPLRQHIYWVE